MKYLIFGNGWLGNMLKEYLGKDADIWIGDIIKFKPDHLMKEYNVWINTVAKTDIDWCEKNEYEAMDINTGAAGQLAELAYYTTCKSLGKVKYVFFSSACIFESTDEKDIKDEDSIPNPQCFYSRTKHMAERLIDKVNPDALIIRLRLPLSEKSHPRNTLDKLIRYNFINNQQESWTIVEDMFPVLKDLIEKNEKGIFHLINEGTISPAEVASAMGHLFALTTKKEQDARLQKDGKAKRVTVFATSKKIPLLPSIQKRMPEIIEKWKEK